MMGRPEKTRPDVYVNQEIGWWPWEQYVIPVSMCEGVDNMMLHVIQYDVRLDRMAVWFSGSSGCRCVAVGWHWVISPYVLSNDLCMTPMYWYYTVDLNFWASVSWSTVPFVGSRWWGQFVAEVGAFLKMEGEQGGLESRSAGSHWISRWIVISFCMSGSWLVGHIFSRCWWTRWGMITVVCRVEWRRPSHDKILFCQLLHLFMESLLGRSFFLNIFMWLCKHSKEIAFVLWHAFVEWIIIILSCRDIIGVLHVSVWMYQGRQQMLSARKMLGDGIINQFVGEKCHCSWCGVCCWIWCFMTLYGWMMAVSNKNKGKLIDGSSFSTIYSYHCWSGQLVVSSTGFHFGWLIGLTAIYGECWS